MTRSWSTLACALLLWHRVAAQFATPSNLTSYNNTSPVTAVVLALDGGCTSYGLVPLTNAAVATITPYNESGYQGYLSIITPQNVGSETDLNIGYVNCDASAYPGNLGQQQIVSELISRNIIAIIFYSTTSAYCNLTLPSSVKFNLFYSTANAVEASKVHDSLNTGPPQNQDPTNLVFIATKQNLAAYLSQSCACSTFCPPNGSTAVAMIILYSITGVITALFLLIIISGAIRAHRHPERYGPRNVLGRPRQSRAKGLARAMLDTIPIVKFGEREPPKDTETELSVAHASLAPGAAAEARQTSSDNAQDISSSPPLPSVTQAGPGIGPAESTEAISGLDAGSLGCSICTDDFENGQDIRVLPCNHKFHPACVDPWLLDVSGTCPLCRVDLRPAAARSEHDESEDTLPPPLAPVARRRAALRNYFASRRSLINSSPEERLQALRQYRQATRAETGASQYTSDSGGARTQRLAGLSRLMRRGRDRESPSAQPQSQPQPQAES